MKGPPKKAWGTSGFKRGQSWRDWSRGQFRKRGSVPTKARKSMKKDKLMVQKADQEYLF